MQQNCISYLTFVPSLRRPELVKSFAERLSERLGLEFYVGLQKSQNSVCQKTLNNSHKQFENAWESFDVSEIKSGSTLLVDDMVDSGWTLTCCGYKLRSAGNGPIYPYALANSAGKGNGDFK